MPENKFFHPTIFYFRYLKLYKGFKVAPLSKISVENIPQRNAKIRKRVSDYQYLLKKKKKKILERVQSYTPCICDTGPQTPLQWHYWAHVLFIKKKTK